MIGMSNEYRQGKTNFQAVINSFWINTFFTTIFSLSRCLARKEGNMKINWVCILLISFLSLSSFAYSAAKCGVEHYTCCLTDQKPQWVISTQNPPPSGLCLKAEGVGSTDCTPSNEIYGSSGSRLSAVCGNHVEYIGESEQ